MAPLRFSLAGLLAFMLLAAFTCAALRYATDLWASASMSLVAMLLLLSVLAAVLRPAARPFWIGFALFGWAYFYVALIASDPAVRSRLITTHFIQHWEGQAESQAFDAHAAAMLDAYVMRKLLLVKGSPAPYPVVVISNIQAIAHAALAILIGLFGGVVGCLIHVRTRQPPVAAEGAKK